MAYNALAIGTPQGKLGCVDAVRVSGGAVRRLFCADQPKAMGADLVWRADGRLEATDQFDARWRKIVDLTTGAVTTLPCVRVAPTVGHDSLRVPGPDAMVAWYVRRAGTLSVRISTPTTTRTILDLGVPRDYSFNSLVWSPDGTWMVAEDSKARLLVISTGAHPTTRLLVDGGWGPAATAQEFVTPRP